MAALLLLVLAPSGDSFWIDEANSAVIARQAGLGAWWSAICEIPSDVQMSPYFLQLWAWAKLAGSNEWCLRFNSYLWAMAGIAFWFSALPRSCRLVFALFAAVSPFLFYYANEIRPYSMLFAGSSLMFASIYRAASDRQSRLLGFSLGAFLALAASAAALPWVGCATLVMAGLLWRGKIAVHVSVGFLTAALAALAVAALYLWSYFQGAHVESPDLSNGSSLLFAGYELFGFLGLGPGRNELRGSGLAALGPYLPLILFQSVLLCAVLWAGLALVSKKLGTARFIALVACCLVPVLVSFFLGVSSGLRITGRHLTPLLALILPLQAVGASDFARRRWGRFATAALLAGLAWSCLQLRVSPQHKKDNYREAAQAAQTALNRGLTVWWAADPRGAECYGLSVAGSPSGTAALLTRNLVELPGTGLPDLVFLNRADAYDRYQVLRKLFGEHHFRQARSLQGFTVWERQP